MKSCVFPRVRFHPLPLTQVWILKVFNRGPRVRRRQRKSGRHLLVGVADPQLSIGEAAAVLIRAETGMFLESQGTLHVGVVGTKWKRPLLWFIILTGISFDFLDGAG